MHLLRVSLTIAIVLAAPGCARRMRIRHESSDREWRVAELLEYACLYAWNQQDRLMIACSALQTRLMRSQEGAVVLISVQDTSMGNFGTVFQT